MFVFPQEVYKFLDDEKRILEEEKKGLEQDKKDLELALNTAQDELKAISDNMAVEEENFDKQRLINVLEGDFPHCLFIRSSLFFLTVKFYRCSPLGAESELDNLGEQVAADQVLQQQLATENRTLKDLLDQV